MDVIQSIVTHQIVFIIIAVSLSMFWGIQGLFLEKPCEDYLKQDMEYVNDIRCSCVQKVFYIIGIFGSEFISSIFGWISFYISLLLLSAGKTDTVSAILMIIAVVGMSGYGYRFSEWFSKSK